MTQEELFKKLIAHCKEYGFIFPSSELYDGLGAQTVLQNFLKWEVVSEWDVGIDFAFLRNRLSGELDYYHRTTDNVVFYVPIATGGGTAELLSNNGRVLNSGFELTLGWADSVGKDFQYNIGLNLSTIANKVLELQGRPCFRQRSA